MVEITENPAQLGYSIPPEWTRHECCWLAWPSIPEYWEGNIQEVRKEFTALCGAIVDKTEQAEELNILVLNTHQERSARESLKKIKAKYHHLQYGDIWLRDTGPIFLTHEDGSLATVRYAFNGWGGKYRYPYDDTVAKAICDYIGLYQIAYPWVIEGGALEVDGEGTCLASATCLLNKNRNPSQSQASMEEHFRQALGIERVIWLDGRLTNDHTDGHVDTLARFVSPGVVACMESEDENDPNFEALNGIVTRLGEASDAKGRRLRIAKIPSPGRVHNRRGDILPASYLNFYISNTKVIVPVFGREPDREALQRLSALFPHRKTVGLAANAILEGGGAFHCITLPQPASRL